PARIIGATDFGRIQEGYLADLCVWDENNDVTLVLKEGREVYRK
ncbi:MAG: amidohydrolase family protein, partial [Clostridia bacterium]|nr:amidohydrolase family protein [Clostridia bacterium]